LSSVVCPTLQYFSTFDEKELPGIKCVFLCYLPLLSEAILILRRTERDIIKNYIGPHVNYPFLLSEFNETSIFFDRFSKKTKIPNFMKIRPQEAELFHADRRTDTTKLIVVFRKFYERALKLLRDM